MVVTYNHGKYIAQALESILSQKTTYNYRIIIGEDASTDNTKEILLEYYKKHPDKMALILWEVNVGTDKNVYQLEKMCTAKYVASLDGDDYWTDPYKLEKQISFLEKHNEFIGTAHNVRCVNEEGNLLHRDYGLYPIREEHIYGKNQALNYELVAHTSSLVYRNFWKTWSEEQFAAYNECCANGDMKVSAYLGLIGDIFYFRDIMSDHRRVFHGDSWTAKASNKNMIDFFNQSYREIKKCMEEILNKPCEFSQVYKGMEEDSLMRLFIELNFKNFWAYCKIVNYNIRARLNRV